MVNGCEYVPIYHVSMLQGKESSQAIAKYLGGCQDFASAIFINLRSYIRLRKLWPPFPLSFRTFSETIYGIGIPMLLLYVLTDGLCCVVPTVGY